MLKMIETKEILFILVVVFVFIYCIIVSCNNYNDSNVTTPKDSNIYVYDDTKFKNKYQVIIIDSCEYLMRSNNNSVGALPQLTHKGNCKFCKERMIYEYSKTK